MSPGPKALLGKYSGLFLKPLRPQHIRKLEKATKGFLVLQDFGAIQVDLQDWYDRDITSNRTWWFRFNQLPTLGWASGVWTESHHARDFIEFNFDVINNWASHSSEKLPLKWHDHASALRMKNMADWYITVANCSTEHDSDLEVLAKLINEHLQWLCDDKNYSRRTNHGFEQARFMMSVASEMPGLPMSRNALEIALLRLENEIRFAFTGQGVHKENSPGYQWFMIKVMQEAKAMLDGYELSLPDIDFRKMLNRAKRFLDAIALPDNSLPLIGDTQHKPKQDAYIEKLRETSGMVEGVKVYDYCRSGYLIVKDFTSRDEPIHLVFKNGHLSDYHRHNDDLSIHLAIGGRVIFGDAGAYSHNAKDVGRRVARSAFGHTTFFPRSRAHIRTRLSDLVSKPKLDWQEENHSIQGLTWAYHPMVLRRSLSWSSGENSFDLAIADSVGNFRENGEALISSFLLHPDVDAHFSGIGQPLRIFLDGTLLSSISYSFSTVRPRVFGSKEGNITSLEEYPFVSTVMKKKKPATRIDFLWREGVRSVDFKVKVYREGAEVVDAEV